MVDAPEAFFDELADAGLDVVSLPPRGGARIPARRSRKRAAAGLSVGLTLNLETPRRSGRRPTSSDIDDLMLMSIRPGWSVQQLNPEVYPRLEAARGEIDRRGLPSIWRSTAA